jgi:dTDP-4-dehydrorhamnose 3,5-epimerase
VDGAILTPLKKIYNQEGDIFHAMKKNDNGFDGFGEAYFSTINKGSVKGWKKHTKMTLNIIVPIGTIKFAVYNEINGEFFSVVLSIENYQRLTIKSGYWLAFKGIDENNILLNLASIEHDPEEVISVDLNKISYEW